MTKLTAFRDASGRHIVPTADTYNGLRYCYVFHGNLFDYRVTYSHGQYFRPQDIGAVPVEVETDENIFDLHFKVA